MTHYQLVASNKRKSWIVIFVFLIFITLVSSFLIYIFDFNQILIGVALGYSTVISFGSYWFSDQIILRLSKARPATKEKYFDFYTSVENLCMSQRMSLPKLFVIDDTALNAFATGRDPQHSAVVVTTGLLSTLNRAEIEAVVAHELTHIKNYDIRLMSVVTILVGFITLLADWFLRFSTVDNRRRNKDSGQLEIAIMVIGMILILISPIIANLIKLAISRSREFSADAGAVAITKNPQGLINALQKLNNDKEPLEVANKATAHLYISNPLKNHHDSVGWFANLFNTHPPIQDRISTLQKIIT